MRTLQRATVIWHDMKSVATTVIVFGLLCLGYIVHGRTDCAQKTFDDLTSEYGKVFCGLGFHECGASGSGCCNE